MRTIAWDDDELAQRASGRGARRATSLVVSTGRNTDFWRKTAYGFVHDDGHFLGSPWRGKRHRGHLQG